MPKKFISMCEQWVILIIFFLAIVGIYTSRGLYADGSYFLYQILVRHGFYIFDEPRKFAQIITQLPVVLALKLGLEDINSLIRVHSVGLIGVPLVFWIGSLFLLRRTYLFWMMLTAFSVTYLRSDFFAVGEFNVTNAIAGFCLSLLIHPSGSAVAAVLLVTAAGILARTYESMMFLGPLLAIFGFSRLFFHKNESQFFRIALVFSNLFFLEAAIIAVYSAFFQRIYDKKSTINLNALYEFHFNYLVAFFLLIILVNSPMNRLKKNLIVVSGLLLSVAYAGYCLRWDATGISYGFYSYAYRSAGSILFAGLISVMWLIEYVPVFCFKRLFHADSLRSMALAALLFCSSAVPMISHSFGFFNWLKTFEREALSVKGSVPVDMTSIARGQGHVSGYNWPWTNTTLSVLLRGSSEALITNASDFSGEDPLDPHKVEKYPIEWYVKRSQFN